MSKLYYCAKTFPELTNDDLYKIMQARNQVFIVEQEILYNDYDEIDLDALHIWLEDEQGLIAYCRIFKTIENPQKISVGRVLTIRRIRRTGMGKKLMHYALKQAQQFFKVDTIYLAAQAYIRKFYEDLGFVAISNEFLEVNIPHIEMKKEL